MGILSSPVLIRNISPKKQQYGMRSKYHQVDGKCHKKNNMQTVQFGCDNNNKRCCWKIKKILKLRFKMGSPLKLWEKLKNAFLSLAGNNGSSSSSSSNLNTAGKRIPKALKVHPTYTNQEFQDRLIFEIYKNLVASRELATQYI